jgi:beta-lactamase class A
MVKLILLNAATQLLNNYVDIPQFKKVFTDLSIAEPNVADLNYTISAKDYTKFIRVLYNGGYIQRQHSELILKLMNESSFKDGILASLGDGAIASTKFGESKKGDMHQIHETGIVYVNNTAYIITIMTEGKDVTKLPEVIKAISKNIYDKMSQTNYNTSIAKI